MKLNGPSVPLVCMHMFGEMEAFSLNPSEGITFESSKITLSDINEVYVTEDHNEIVVCGQKDGDTEIFYILNFVYSHLHN